MTDISYGAAPVAASATKPRSFFKRFLDAVIEARMKQARREISQHLHLVPEEALKQAGFEIVRPREGSSSRL
jgi:hypothetical protein